MMSPMARKDYLDGHEMSTTFRVLRSNRLVWHYFVHSYLYGENRRRGVARPVSAANQQLVAGLDALARDAMRTAAAGASGSDTAISGALSGARHLRARALNIDRPCFRLRQ